METLTARMKNPAMIIAEAMKPIQALYAAAGQGGVPPAALELAEAVTRLSDRADPVPDEIWDQAARHYDERGLAALILMIPTTNFFNRLNVSTRQPAGAWG